MKQPKDWRIWCIHTNDEIAGFAGPWEPFCNFYQGCNNGVMAFEGGFIFPTSEHAYQFAKREPDGRSADIARGIMNLSPAEVKRWGREEATKRPGWDSIKIHVMRHVVFSKFLRNPACRGVLADSGTRDLVERNWWGDTFWGTDLDGNGSNHLGKILMQTRAYWHSETSQDS